MKTTIPLARSSIKHSPLRRSVIFISLAIACFALSQTAKAVVPAPDGGYLNGNTAEGDNALFNLDTSQGLDNTATGFEALYSNTTGDNNTAIGALALYHNTTGNSNTATGFEALFENTTGSDNTATGFEALLSNTTGTFNTATGWDALFGNTTGVGNTANGSQALAGNITGNDNTAIGGFTLPNNSTGSNNTATGLAALQLNTIGNNNTGNGDRALQENTTGSNNTATGRNALLLNTTGNFNTAMGGKALKNNSTGSSNIAVGFRAGELIDGSANIDVGNVGVAGESGTIRFGTLGRQTNAYVAGISGVTVPAGVGVIIDSDGHLGTVVSSARFKDAVKPMDKASDAIFALKPVTFRYKHDVDPEGIPQFGLVAEEVEKVNPDLVARDDQGKPYTVRYDAVNAMLLNEFLKEHHQLQDLKAIVAEQQNQIKALTSGLEKVSAQVASSRPASQIANNQ